MSESFEKVKRASRRSALLSVLGFVIIVTSLLYSSMQLNTLERTIEVKEAILNTKEQELKKLDRKIIEANYTQNSILNFLVSVTDEKKVHLLDPSVDWKEVKRQLDVLPPGSRKNAILNAILLAWKDIPFSMGNEGVSSGFDSPRFVRYVLSTVGIYIKDVRGVRLSDTLMGYFEKVDVPRPGDLVFFRGQIGSFGFILAVVGKKDQEHVGIGTLQKIAPLQIISMGNINTPVFPLIGYYRVIYPDEQSPNKPVKPTPKSSAADR